MKFLAVYCDVNLPVELGCLDMWCGEYVGCTPPHPPYKHRTGLEAPVESQLPERRDEEQPTMQTAIILALTITGLVNGSPMLTGDTCENITLICAN